MSIWERVSLLSRSWSLLLHDKVNNFTKEVQGVGWYTLPAVEEAN